jgi:hypothetical protein
MQYCAWAQGVTSEIIDCLSTKYSHTCSGIYGAWYLPSCLKQANLHEPTATWN